MRHLFTAAVCAVAAMPLHAGVMVAPDPVVIDFEEFEEDSFSQFIEPSYSSAGFTFDVVRGTRFVISNPPRERFPDASSTLRVDGGNAFALADPGTFLVFDLVRDDGSAFDLLSFEALSNRLGNPSIPVTIEPELTITTIDTNGLTRSETLSFNLERTQGTVFPSIANNIISIRFSQTVNAERNSVSSFDNFTLVPEPASLAFLTAGSLLLLRRRSAT